ncbi:UDP-N-acetylmuramoyl-L-alanyl-D-glutamate--2,6-diaminopimelate ligase [Lutibaculum baratangense]|uniref:UDP-N-acetylmuramoyl-L-alanyl-D-glutamate--2, 6-diaminopimelate ligase n=1 Tax=Lutibaculum baratangense TaxID=1358440 RepID=UPI0006844C09|nr:UDP-N-acetylmuramoyl-L-alanyl-D-glutamate--2,6-diaminopimelate ligase [Lutibaculum baratangense]
MRLADLVDVPDELDPAQRDIEIVGVTADSREVRPGYLFAALPGTRVDGAQFLHGALEAGAAAAIAARSAAVHVEDARHAPVVRVDEPRGAFARAVARFYHSQPETIVAVTGTSGKTSVASFVRQMFEASGFMAASLGTLGVVAPGKAAYGSLTTPDTVRLHQVLAELAGAGVTHLAMEASSHGLDQHRLDGVRIQAAGFTNLGRDHLDYHPTVEAYLEAKLRLFRSLLPDDGTAVVDVDSAEGRAVAEVCEGRGVELLRVGREGKEIRLLGLRPDGFQQHLELEVLGARVDLSLPLAGEFQAANALVAAGLALAGGAALPDVLQAMTRLEGAKGRLELVGSRGNGALVFVDYAHKPDALDNVLRALRPFAKGRLAVVFGCGGDRDPGKRPIMGEVATRLADRVYVTDDNPRSEEPAAIRAAIMETAPGATEIGDRRTAIAQAIADLDAGDILVVAGKGHETGQIVGSRTLPFSDHEVVAEVLAEEKAE